jgi:hypothetical protein
MSQIENLALEVFVESEIIRKAIERRDVLKEELLNAMNDAGSSEQRVPLGDKPHDLKVTVTNRKSKKLDKEQMAEDLGVPVSAINIDFLLKCVEDGKLTASQYKDYIDVLYNEGVTVRRVNAL